MNVNLIIRELGKADVPLPGDDVGRLRHLLRVVQQPAVPVQGVSVREKKSVNIS